MPVRCETRELPPAERRKSAVQTLGLFWGLALVTAPLPPIHWVTVPGFFCFGIYASLKKYKAAVELRPLSFPCPECRETVELTARSFQPDIALTCPHCRYLLRLRCGVVG